MQTKRKELTAFMQDITFIYLIATDELKIHLLLQQFENSIAKTRREILEIDKRRLSKNYRSFDLRNSLLAVAEHFKIF